MLHVPLLDYFIRPRQQRWRDREAEGLGGLEVDGQLELRRLLDGQERRTCSPENLVHEDRATGEEVWEIDTIRHEAAGLHKILRLVGGGDVVLRCEFRKKPHVLECEGAAADDDRVYLMNGHGSEAILKLTHSVGFVPERLDLEGTRR